MALLIVAAAILSWQSVTWLYSVMSTGDSADATQQLTTSGPIALTQSAVGHVFGVPLIAISTFLMTLLLLMGEVLFRVLGVSPTPLPPPIPAPEAASENPSGSDASQAGSQSRTTLSRQVGST